MINRNSRWLSRGGAAALMVVAVITLAACGGSDGLSEEEEAALQQQLDAAEAQAAADAAAKKASDAAAKKAAEDAAAAAKLAEEAAAAARQAVEDQKAAEAAAEKAKEEKAEAEKQKAEAEKEAAVAEAVAEEARRNAQTAETQRQQEEQARQAAEQEADEAEKKAEAAEKRLSQSSEEHQFAGLGTSAGTLAVTPRNVLAAIIGTPSIGVGTSGLAVGSWAVTTGSGSDGTYRDTVTVYSDVGAPTMVPFQDSDYNAGKRVVNAQGEIIAGYRISGARTDVGGSGFPATSTRPQTFQLVDRGYDTQAQKDTAVTRCGADQTCIDAANALIVRDKDTHPLRYSVDVTTATLGGAGGTFRCESSSSSSACTVQRRGTEQLFFTGPWSFRPTAADTDVTVDDEHFMWFGVWAREHVATRKWSFAVGHGPAGSRVSNVSAVSGSATYTGNAIGRFAIDRELGDDEAGAFTATASLNADFNANTLSGQLTAFGGGVPTGAESGDGAWTVHLRSGSISGGGARGTSAWSIGTDADEGGEWAASFYSQLPANQRTGVVPYGVAGTFTAEHSGIAKMIGAFGAHK